MDEAFLEATISIRGIVRRQDGAVLVVRRSSDGGWELPGGRIRRTEAVVDCLRREIREETDLSVSVRRPVHAVSWQNDADEDRFAVYYHCPTTDDGVTLSGEHTAAAWLDDVAAETRLSEPQAAATRAVIDAE